MFRYPLFFFAIFVVGFVVVAQAAYIPAVPTNTTQDKDKSTLLVQWYPNGSLTTQVSWRSLQSHSTGDSEGALVHFSNRDSDVNASTPATATPWIAFVSCDSNSTAVTNQQEDIFTLARDKGAVSVVMYSLYSVTCTLNAQYTNSIVDIASTSSLTSSHLVYSQFSRTSYTDYNSRTLNDSLASVTNSLTPGSPTSPGYLIASLKSNTTATHAPTTSPTKKKTHPDTAVIAGAVVSGVVLLIVIVLSAFCLCQRGAKTKVPRERTHDSLAASGLPLTDTAAAVAARTTLPNLEEEQTPSHADPESGYHDPTRLEYTREGIQMSYEDPNDRSVSLMVPPETNLPSSDSHVSIQLDPPEDIILAYRAPTTPPPPQPSSSRSPNSPSPMKPMHDTTASKEPPSSSRQDGNNEEVEWRRQVEELRAEVERLKMERQVASPEIGMRGSDWRWEIGALRAEVERLRTGQSATLVDDDGYVSPPTYSE